MIATEEDAAGVETDGADPLDEDGGVQEREATARPAETKETIERKHRGLGPRGRSIRQSRTHAREDQPVTCSLSVNSHPTNTPNRKFEEAVSTRWTCGPRTACTDSGGTTRGHHDRRVRRSRGTTDAPRMDRRTVPRSPSQGAADHLARKARGCRAGPRGTAPERPRIRPAVIRPDGRAAPRDGTRRGVRRRRRRRPRRPPPIRLRRRIGSGPVGSAVAPPPARIQTARVHRRAWRSPQHDAGDHLGRQVRRPCWKRPGRATTRPGGINVFTPKKRRS